MVDCVQPTQYGYVAHFTYAADDLPERGLEVESRPAATRPATKNKLSIGGVDAGTPASRQWIEIF